MKLKKCTSIILITLTLVLIFSISTYSCLLFPLGTGEGYANILEQMTEVEQYFRDGIGPETNGYTIDYKYYSPVKKKDKTQYPLVIWLQGQGNNEEPGNQLDGNDIEAWATKELQQRFTGTKGAYIFVPRAPKKIGWDKSLISPLKAAIDDFIAENKKNIDVTRIYIGGFSLGGWMTLNTAAAYPEMFAAIFVSCPALGSTYNIAKKIADIPVWITSGKNDFAVNYYTTVKRTWKKIISKTNVPEQCRFSTLRKTSNPDGEIPSFGHSSWYAINYDMFSSKDGRYPRMYTVDGNNKIVKLTYPDGMISWLSAKTSDYAN